MEITLTFNDCYRLRLVVYRDSLLISISDLIFPGYLYRLHRPKAIHNHSADYIFLVLWDHWDHSESINLTV